MSPTLPSPSMSLLSKSLAARSVYAHSQPTAAASLSPRKRRLLAQRKKWEEEQQRRRTQQLDTQTQQPQKPPEQHQPQLELQPLQHDTRTPALPSIWDDLPSSADMQAADASLILLHWAEQARSTCLQQQQGQQDFDLCANASANVSALLQTSTKCSGCMQTFLSLWTAAHFVPLLPDGGQLKEQIQSLERENGLPFSVLPMFLPALELQGFTDEVQLSRSSIWLNDVNGTREVPESRLTSWQSDIGATFMYSGTEREGPPMTPCVAQVRDALQEATGQHYDSVLINYYEDERVGMRFHSDPLYDTWTPETAVVSIGAPRRFAFRAIDNYEERVQFPVRNGDVVVMRGDCQDRFQHSVIVEKAAGSPYSSGPRMSLSGLHAAASHAAERSVETVRILLAAGASCSLCNRVGKNAIHLACSPSQEVAVQERKAVIVQMLLDTEEGKSLINVPDSDGNTPLHLCARNGLTAVCRVLCGTIGIQVNCRINGGDITPLCLAVWFGHLEMQEVLLEHGTVDDEQLDHTDGGW